MRTVLILFAILLVCGSALAQAPAARSTSPVTSAPTLPGKLTSSVDEELAKTVAELNDLRERIAAERLPLAGQLTEAEERLAALRREYDEASRSVDTGNLDMITLKAEIKARKDEMDYIGNLLGEYTLAYETRVHMSELQYAAEPLSRAKQAGDNTALAQLERFLIQIQFVDFSLDRMMEVIGGMTFPGVGVGPEGTVEPGKYLIVGPMAYFRGNNGKTGGVVIPQTGSDKPLIRPLEGPRQLALMDLVQAGHGTLLLDPTRGGALKAVQHKTDLVRVFKKGGPIMWPLLVAAVLALLTVIERVIFIILEGFRRDPKALENFLAAAGRGDLAAAIQISKQSKFYLVRTLGYALEHREKSLSTALIYAQEQEMKRFRRGIPVLDTVITLAPLLGLLGTVTGMMNSFAVIGGELSAPGAITGGIAEALIATAFGLGIAITGLIPFNYLNNKVDEARIEVETAATQLELLVHPSALALAEAEALQLELANA